MAQHAVLSASSSSRWMACPPSARLEQNYENKTSEAAREGTLAHELGEITLQNKLGLITTRKYNATVKKIEQNKLYAADMPDYVEMYVDTCMEKVAEAKAKTPDALFKIEQRLDFSEWVPQGFGTGDFVIIADGTMEICDLKYGKGVPVTAIGNKQMRLYALGVITQFSFLYGIEKVRMTIIQPRLDSITTDEMTVDDLLKWANEVLKPIAELAFKGEGEFSVGDHCEFCKVADCEHRALENMELAKYDFAVPGALSENDIADILGKIDELVKWSSTLKDYALEQALQGKEYPGWKLVEGRSNRKYTDVDAIADTLKSNNYTEEQIFKPKELLTLTNMEKVIGKKNLTELIGTYIEKPQGKPVLVIEADKRSIYNSAEADFK